MRRLATTIATTLPSAAITIEKIFSEIRLTTLARISTVRSVFREKRLPSLMFVLRVFAVALAVSSPLANRTNEHRSKILYYTQYNFDES